MVYEKTSPNAIRVELNCTSREKKKKSKRIEKDKRGRIYRKVCCYKACSEREKIHRYAGDFNTFHDDYIRAILWNNRKKRERGENTKKVSLSIFYGNRFFIRLNLPQ